MKKKNVYVTFGVKIKKRGRREEWKGNREVELNKNNADKEGERREKRAVRERRKG